MAPRSDAHHHRRGGARRAIRVGATLPQGTVVGHATTAGRVSFAIRPAGRRAPQIDPRPILDGWRLLQRTAEGGRGRNGRLGRQLEVGRVLLANKPQLIREVLHDGGVHLSASARQDVADGTADRRVLATLEYLRASGLHPTVSVIKSGHGRMTASGNVSEHSSGDAVDISRLNGTPILDHQGPGSITDVAVRRLAGLQGTVRPHQIISLMTLASAPNTLALPDHADHIHVGFSPTGAAVDSSVLQPAQWDKLLDRLQTLDDPLVGTK